MMLTAMSGISFNAEAAQVSGNDVVAYARQFAGYPYVYATHGPDSFDCSGFVYYVYKHFGIDLPLSSTYYWNSPATYGTVVGNGSVDNAQPGDVISWYGHVAIYIGNGKTIEALGAKYGVVDNYPLSNHSDKNYRVIRIYGVVSGDTVVNEEKTSDVVEVPDFIGWQKIDGKWYYYTEGGYCLQYWNKIGGKWYYFNQYGAMKTGWLKYKNKWYYLTSSGAMKTGWLKYKNKWYYLTSSGAMKTGWLKDKGKWYYLDPTDGYMYTGKHKIKGKWYTFNSSGALKE